MIDQVGDRNRLTIGEDVEFTLVARQLGLRPAGALGSVGSIVRFPVINGVGYLTILWSWARVNVPKHARRLAAAWNAFLEAETTAIENVALRRIRRAGRKKHRSGR